VPTRRYPARLRGAEARLWSGRTAHLVGGTLDFVQALARYMLARRGRADRRARRGRIAR
jgi:hypothetical protein